MHAVQLARRKAADAKTLSSRVDPSSSAVRFALADGTAARAARMLRAGSGHRKPAP
jgi:hypothetical protein